MQRLFLSIRLQNYKTNRFGVEALMVLQTSAKGHREVEGALENGENSMAEMVTSKSQSLNIKHKINSDGASNTIQIF